jgi:hypothetical protein
MQPNTLEDWLSVATARATDAVAILERHEQSIGPVYLVGYAIECSLKAYLMGAGIRFPTSGRAGHDLTALWKASGFQKRDLDDRDGSRAFYLETWDTSLRYARPPAALGLSNQQLVDGAKFIVRWLHNQARRDELRRRGRR